MPNAPRKSELDKRAENLIREWRKLAKKGSPEQRRDGLYAWALVPGGAWDADAQLDQVMRRAKDLGAEMDTPFEMVYVYDRPPVWTCEPSDYVREFAHAMEIRRETGAQRRWEWTAPSGSLVEGVAKSVVGNLTAAEGLLMVRYPAGPPAGDPVIARIDAVTGLAN